LKRIVLDTNVTISALFWKGPPRVVFDLVKDGKVTLLFSSKIEAELIRVLAYSKFDLTSTEIFPIIKHLRKHAHFVGEKSNIEIIKDDPTDNIFLDCAIDGNADYIISGDHHLLNLGSYESIRIITAKDFLINEGFIGEP
jgi:putative PIN family toxin of toxin-antitoxin system